MVMPPAGVCTHETTQATVSVTNIGTQCALRFVSSAGSQTETALADLEASSPPGGASLHPASLDGVDSSGPARDHVDEPPGDCSSFTSSKGKTTGDSTMTQMRGNLWAGQSCQQSSYEKTLLTVDPQQAQSVMRPYACNVCKGTFLRLADVLTHMKVHSNEDRYACSVCQESFGTNQGLVKHQQWHTNGEPYACSICHKVFTDRRGVVRHERVHTNEKPHVCSVCGKSFVRRSCLVRHERTHTGERPYVCSVCHKGFTEKCKLVIHQKMHTREMPHVCSTCHKGFPYKFHLVSHERSHTGEEL